MALARPGGRLRGVYYGWWIVAAWVVLNVYFSGTLVYGLTVFFTPVRQTFGWSAALLALIFSLANVCSGLLAPAYGAWFDRAGPRPLMLTGSACSAVGLAALSQTRSLGAFVLAYALVSLGYAAWSGTGIATIGHWFERRRGAAMGAIVAGSSLGGLLVPLWQSVVGSAGWRDAFLVAGLGMLVVGLGASSVLRHRPSDLGLVPDGAAAPVGAPSAPESDGDSGFWAACYTPQFWLIGGVTSVILGGSTAATVLLLPRLREAGVGAAPAAAAATAAILLGVIGRPIVGLLADRRSVPRLAAAVFVLQAFGLLAFALAPQRLPLLLVFVLGYGLSNDSVRMLASLLLLRYFGRRAFGRILGVQQFLLIPTRVLGPVVAGAVNDAGHGYGAAFVFYAAASLLMTLPMLLLRPPRISSR